MTLPMCLFGSAGYVIRFPKRNPYQIVTLVAEVLPRQAARLVLPLPLPCPLLFTLLGRGCGDRRQRSRWHIETQKIHLASRPAPSWAEQTILSVHVSLGTTPINKHYKTVKQLKLHTLEGQPTKYVKFPCSGVTMQETIQN